MRESGNDATTETARTRSWWGWGTIEDAATGPELEALLARITALLPNADLTDHQPPEVTALNLPAARATPPSSLASLCSDDLLDRASHAHGKGFRDVARNLQGDMSHAPDLVIRPQNEQDIIDVLDWCTENRHAVIPYGGGSSVVGGVEPRFTDFPATVTLDLGRLNQVLEIDHTSRAARIQAGVLGPDLENALRPHGLSLRHFPQSFEFSTLGGWLATRAGGHYATRLTHIDDMVESMRVVSPTGVGESWRLPGSGAGPSPDRMFLGSEGTLGLITEAWMRLQERPVHRAGASVIFDSFEEAVEATRAVAQSGLDPANCRLLDTVESALNAGITTGGGVLVLGFESADHPVDTHLARATELCRQHGGTVHDPVENRSASPAQAWRTSFLRMPYHRDALARRSMILETFETSCTWDAFPALHAAVTEAAQHAFADVTGSGLLTCRFTHVYPDGPAPYYGVYAPGKWGSVLSQWDEIKSAVSEVLVKHHATITHHHAVGRDHRPWYDRQRPELFASALAGAKRALDPAGVLNPGVLLQPAS